MPSVHTTFKGIHFVFILFLRVYLTFILSAEAADHAPTVIEEQTNPELAKYLNRSYWESLQSNEPTEQVRPASPSAPATAPVQNNDTKYKAKENGVADNDLEEFIQTLKSQVEIFINRMKSNSSRGRFVYIFFIYKILNSNCFNQTNSPVKFLKLHRNSYLLGQWVVPEFVSVYLSSLSLLYFFKSAIKLTQWQIV